MERMEGQARMLSTALGGQAAGTDTAIHERTKRAVMAIRAGTRTLPAAKQRVSQASQHSSKRPSSLFH